MLAHANGMQCSVEMHMIGSRDGHCVNRVTHLFKHLATIPETLRLWEFFEGTGSPSLIDITETHDIGTGSIGSGDITGTLASGTNPGNGVALYTRSTVAIRTKLS